MGKTNQQTIVNVSSVKQQKKPKINIVFLCGSLEPGRDGVGDYTRRLASELIEQGHQAGAVALNDKFLNHVTKEMQICRNNKVNVLRIPTGSKQKIASELLKAFVIENNADWLSLQFVPFAFHPKGLPFDLKKILGPVINRYKTHVMFHELWVAMEKRASPVHKLWGWLQYKMICNLVQLLKPQVVHTHCHLYHAQITKFYSNVKVLPLFSNVELLESSFSQSQKRPCTKMPEIMVVIFGSIHYGAPIAKFAGELSLWVKKSNRLLGVKFVGRNGSELSEWKKAFQKVNANLEVLGERSSQEIAEVLQSASFGLTSTPFHLVEKSGTVAAMLEFGLPIICVARPWEPKLKYTPKRIGNVIEYKEGKLEQSLNEQKLFPYRYSASVAADELVNTLINF